MSPPPAQNSYRWSKENYSRPGRLIDVWRFVLLFLFYRWWDGKAWSYGNGATEEHRVERRRNRAIWVRETMLDLGPTFIKVGQLFSTRADLFPKEYVEELSKLQDEVPAFEYSKVVTIIEAEFGRSIKEIFQFFDPTPMAAASLGQVHRAQLNTDEEVVVKVQRPGLQKLFDIDLQILRGVTSYLQNHPRYGKGREWLPIYDECAKILYEEIDYLNEGRNADTFRRNFRNDDLIHVPKVYWRYSSPKVLTLEYSPGIKISNYEAIEAAGLDRKVIARIGARSYLQQLLEDGFFHADPHPGNLAVRPDGVVVFYDFGMMGSIKPGTKEKLMDTFLGVAQKDTEKVIAALTDLGAIKPGADQAPIRRSVEFLLTNFADQPFEQPQNLSIGDLSDDIYEMAYDQPFRFPATFTFVLRALSTLEGLGKGLDPGFNFMEVAQPFATQLVSDASRSMGGPVGIINEFGRQAVQAGSTAANLPKRIEETLNRVEKGDVRIRVRANETDRLLRRLNIAAFGLMYAILLSGLLVSTAVLYSMGHTMEASGGLALSGFTALAMGRVLFKLQRAVL